ncbi:MAG: preprotein translocase subunit SecG [Patescibacteria group bacterium]|nr:preprotein translocase subunit SecG [Patescibacteria group bacterium]
MSQILKIVQIILAILLTAAILVQARGTGLGSAFGGEGGFYRTKRGVEKIVFRATIFLAIAFGAIALVNVLI